MNREVQRLHNALGANWQEQNGLLVVSEYGNTPNVIRAVEEGVALFDRTHWGRLRVSGRDHRTFLHNYTTADIKRAEHGEIRQAVALTATARLIDLLTILLEETSALLITSPERRHLLPHWFRRFIFFNTDVTIVDETETSAFFSLVGPQSTPLLRSLGATLPAEQRWHETQVADHPAIILSHSGLAAPGWRLIVADADAPSLFRTLIEAGESFGVEPGGMEAWEILRVLHGRPAADHEITEAHNPLEAGLWAAISFDKGCYIGQEVVARLDTYDKIKQHLMLVRLSEAASEGAPIEVEGREVGTLTSLVQTPQGEFVGLGYIRREWARPGQLVHIPQSGKLIRAVLDDCRYIEHQRPAT